MVIKRKHQEGLSASDVRSSDRAAGGRQDGSGVARSSRRFGLVLLGAALLAAAAGCGSGSDKDSGSASTPTITVAQAAKEINFGAAYIAQTLGFYKDAGVNVKLLDETGANTTTLVASGQAQLGELGPGAPLLMTKQGKPTTILYQQADAAAAAYLVAGPQTKSIDDIRGKRLGTFSVGSGTYAFAVRYNRDLGLKANLVPFQNPSAMVAGLAAKQVAAGTGAYTNYADQIKAGKLHLLIDPNVPAQRAKYVGDPYPAGVTFGLVDTVKKNRKAVVGYLEGRQRAVEWMNSHTPDEVSAQLRKSPNYKEFSADALKVSIERGLVFAYPSKGEIDEKTWEYALTQYATWGLDGFDATDPQYAYAKRVDMSYLDEANSKIK